MFVCLYIVFANKYLHFFFLPKEESQSRISLQEEEAGGRRGGDGERQQDVPVQGRVASIWQKYLIFLFKRLSKCGGGSLAACGTTNLQATAPGDLAGSR